MTDKSYRIIFTCPVAIYIAVTMFAACALFPPILPARADPVIICVQINKKHHMPFHYK